MFEMCLLPSKGSVGLKSLNWVYFKFPEFERLKQSRRDEAAGTITLCFYYLPPEMLYGRACSWCTGIWILVEEVLI